MPTVLIPAGDVLEVHDVTPSDGLVSFNVEANEPITIYLTDRRGYDHYFAGQLDRFQVFDQESDTTKWTKKIELVPGMRWYLLIVNTSDQPRAAHYEIVY